MKYILVQTLLVSDLLLFALLILLHYAVNTNFLYPFQIKGPVAFQWTESFHF